jgi:hypothetical protein
MTSEGGTGDEALFEGVREEDTGRVVEVEGEGVGGGQPEEVLGLVIEADAGGAGAGDVVEEEEMFGAEEFRGVDAILDEGETDVVDFDGGFLADFAAEGVDGGLAAFDFSAGDAPAVAPFTSLSM